MEALQEVQQNQSLAAVQAGVGMAGFDDAPLKPAEMEIVQFTSQTADATPGHFRNRRTGEEFKEIRVVPIKYWNGRVLFPPGGDLKSKPLCKSYDGKVPVQFEGLIPQSPFCETCDYSKWANGKPPACKSTIRWLFIDKETGAPFYLTAKGTGVKPSKTVIDALREYAFIANNRGEPRSLYDFTFTIALRYEQNSKGKWYALEFKDIKKLEEVGKYAPLYAALTSRNYQAEDEAEIDNAVQEEAVSI